MEMAKRSGLHSAAPNRVDSSVSREREIPTIATSQRNTKYNRAI